MFSFKFSVKEPQEEQEGSGAAFPSTVRATPAPLKTEHLKLKTPPLGRPVERSNKSRGTTSCPAALNPMPVIERDIQVRWRHQVHFTEDVFATSNPVLRDVLSGGRNGRTALALIIVDESLVLARPELLPSLHTYFTTHSEAIRLVCPPVSIVGGEAVKNAYLLLDSFPDYAVTLRIQTPGYQTFQTLFTNVTYVGGDKKTVPIIETGDILLRKATDGK